MWFLFSLRIKKIGGAVLGLHCCARTFSSCSKSGLLSRCGKQASHSSGFPCCRAVVVALRLYSTGSVLWCTGKDVPWHMGSSPITDPTQVPCTGRRILSHWTTSKVQFLFSDQTLTDPGARLPWSLSRVMQPYSSGLLLGSNLDLSSDPGPNILCCSIK